IRSAPAGGDAYQRVLRGEAVLLKIAASLRRVVFCALHGSPERGVSTRDYPLHHLRRRVVGRRTLRGVENAEASGGSCAEIEEASPLIQAGTDAVDGGSDMGQ